MDRTGAVEEVGSGAVEVAVGVVGTTGTRRRTLPSFPTFEGINARYVRGIVRVSRGGCLPAMPGSLEQTGALPSSLGDSVTRWLGDWVTRWLGGSVWWLGGGWPYFGGHVLLDVPRRAPSEPSQAYSQSAPLYI